LLLLLYVYFTQAGYYQELPDTLSATKAAAASMDLSHTQYAPTPKSIRWWGMTLLLLGLGVWQRMLRSGFHLGFTSLQWLNPRWAGQLAVLQQRQQPPWKNVGYVPSSSGSKARSEAAAGRQRSSIEGAAGKGLVDGSAAVGAAAARELAPAYA
jgi:hypothetical protein